MKDQEKRLELVTTELRSEGAGEFPKSRREERELQAEGRGDTKTLEQE
jgi:hypothetical protein